jgi:hypothetical protein
LAAAVVAAALRVLLAPLVAAAVALQNNKQFLYPQGRTRLSWVLVALVAQQAALSTEVTVREVE